jgi:hypothetical protein
MRRVYPVEIEIPLDDLYYQGYAIEGEELRHQLLDALEQWRLDNPDLLQGASYVCETLDDDTSVVTTTRGRIK